MAPVRQPPAATLLTRRFALSPREVLTSAVALAVSTGGYLSGGQPYLARGVVGDLLAFAALGSVAGRTHARVRHEAAVCLTAIASVLLAHPAWPLHLSEALWWALFALGLAGYLAIRWHVCN